MSACGKVINFISIALSCLALHTLVSMMFYMYFAARTFSKHPEEQCTDVFPAQSKDPLLCTTSSNES